MIDLSNSRTEGRRRRTSDIRPRVGYLLLPLVGHPRLGIAVKPLWGRNKCRPGRGVAANRYAAEGGRRRKARRAGHRHALAASTVTGDMSGSELPRCTILHVQVPTAIAPNNAIAVRQVIRRAAAVAVGTNVVHPCPRTGCLINDGGFAIVAVDIQRVRKRIGCEPGWPEEARAAHLLSSTRIKVHAHDPVLIRIDVVACDPKSTRELQIDPAAAVGGEFDRRRIEQTRREIECVDARRV